MKATRKQFEQVWNYATSIKEVADHFGMTVRGASRKACVLRRDGVFMKDMNTRRAKSKSYKSMTAEEFQKIAERSSSYQHMAKLTGIKPYTLSRIAKKLGIVPRWGKKRQWKRKLKKETLNAIAVDNGFDTWHSLVRAIWHGECFITVHRQEAKGASCEPDR